MPSVERAREAAQAAPATLIAEGGFEAPALAAGAFAYRPAGSAWAFEGQAGLAANGSAFTLKNPPAPGGAQAAFIQGAGAIRQVVGIAPDAAGTYRLSFLAARRANVSDAAHHDFAVTVGGAEVATFRAESPAWGRRSVELRLAPGPRAIEFTGLNSAGGDNTTLIDEVGLEFVRPDPAFPAPPDPPAPRSATVTYVGPGPRGIGAGARVVATAILTADGRFLGADGMPRDAFDPESCLIPCPERPAPRLGTYRAEVVVSREVPEQLVLIAFHLLASDGTPLAPHGEELPFYHDPATPLDRVGYLIQW